MLANGSSSSENKESAAIDIFFQQSPGAANDKGVVSGEKSKCESSIQGTYISSSSQYGIGGDLRLPVPPHTKEGDLLILFLSRTDDVLPMELDGWTTGPSCFKERNQANQCWTVEDCQESTVHTSSGIKYCTKFPRSPTGEADLATIVFYKQVSNNNNDATIINEFFHWNLPGYHPAWASVASISGVNMTNSPIRSSAGTSCDRQAAGVFPSVYGQTGDVLLLSLAHDDPADNEDFKAPAGTQLVQDMHGPDEAGFLFAQRLNDSGNTRTYSTEGKGSTEWSCKDALLSVVIQMLPSKDNNLLVLGNDHCINRRFSPAAAASNAVSSIINLSKWIMLGIEHNIGV